MLHLKFALNLEHLADEMMEKMKDCWNDPFNSPVVIFPDPKLEQWFRLRWMKKYGVLANLNKSTIDRFLFDILVGKDDSKKKLTAEMLTNVILAYLEKDGNYKTLCSEGDDEVTRYLEVDGKLDYNHLFDFASKMASLFLDYETSRPAKFVGGKEGFLDKWCEGVNDKDGLFFTETREKLELREKWQRKLYSAVFHKHEKNEPLLAQVFKKEAERIGENKEYDTIPFLFKACENGNFNLEKLPKDNDGETLPIFIFGLSGMGQFYRVILQKYAEQHEVYAYIQNPCMEFWEDVSSNVHRNWTNKNGSWGPLKDEKGNIKGEFDPAGIETVQENMAVKFSGDFEHTDPDDVKESVLPQENDLLASWGRSGRDNIKLWCTASDYDFDFKGNVNKDGKDAEIPQDNLLHKVQRSVARREKLNGVTAANLADDKSLDITAAPTKIREIENLHTQICKLLHDGARVEDILVVSPCLDEYRTAINMVFDQTPVKDPKDEDGFLHVRFAIVDSPARASLTENVLSNLFSILAQKSITRPDFFALVRNPVVQNVRGIRNEEIDAWQEWVVETNTYRTHDTKDDWDKVVKRLLLAQMTADDISFDGNEYRPYADMACSDKVSLCRFVECVESLERWLEFGCDKSVTKGDFLKKIDCTQLSELSAHLDEWIGMQNTPKPLKSEDIVHKRVAEALEQLYCQFSASASEISMNIVKQSLLLAAQGTEYSCGNLFVNGVTFMKFVPNRTIPVKHLFFIGADATSFPGAKQRNTLDLRKSCYPWPGDDSPIAKNRYAFLCQLMSTSESFHLSYVNKDIKKDAELYPSSVVNDLRKFIEAGTEKDTDGKSLKWKEKTISLDENRDYSDLWTQKSLRNYVAYKRMLDDRNPLEDNSTPGKVNEAITEQKPLVKLPDRVTFYSLTSFLKDPFQFHVNRMLMEEDEEDIEKEIFEPVYLNNLDTSVILKKRVAAALSADGSDERKEIEKLQKDLAISGKMPDGVFGQKQEEILKTKENLILEQMVGTYNDVVGPAQKSEDESKYIFKKDWSFGAKIQDMMMTRSDDSHWLLSGKLDWCDAKSDEIEKATQIIEVASTDKKNTELSLDRYISSYIKALCLIAYKGVKDPKIKDPQTINVSIYSCDPFMSGPATTTVSFTPDDAKKKLEEIYANAFGKTENIEKGDGKIEKKNVSPYCKAVPAELLDWPKSGADKDERDIFAFWGKLVGDYGAWGYFDKKSLFNPVTDIGYTESGFETEWNSAKEFMKALIKIEKYKAPPSRRKSSTDTETKKEKTTTRKTKAKK